MNALRRFGFAVAAILPMIAFVNVARADDYPNKPIRLVLPYAAGGVTDLIGRVIATAMSSQLGQTVYPDNRGGAGGTIGAGFTAKSAPDGYTIVMTSPPMVGVAPVLLSSLPYDAVEDFTPIGTVATTPNILVVTPSLPVKTLQDLVAYAKDSGHQKLTFASSGPGSTGHLSGQILMTATGIQMTHVPYKSASLAFPDVLAGRVSMVFDSLPSTLGYVRSGLVRPIAVMSDKRSTSLPDVPTAAESGFPAATMLFWMGIEGPAGMPPAIVNKLNAALKAAVMMPATREQLATMGAEPFLTTPKEYGDLRRNDAAKLNKLVKEMGLVPGM
jgi:tripartite-type tricarboxylate transporter receptor subunit TctC